ncbi:endolytic transglycosylase MltG [Rhodococcus sp. NPDC058521]|uniref:endolytic transglycosylase MltG n=1 Tax=Rhodococcus sp. NPDC058521 TaxID=3346536 RepID=UPI00365C1F7B
MSDDRRPFGDGGFVESRFAESRFTQRGNPDHDDHDGYRHDPYGEDSYAPDGYGDRYQEPAYQDPHYGDEAHYSGESDYPEPQYADHGYAAPDYHDAEFYERPRYEDSQYGDPHYGDSRYGDSRYEEEPIDNRFDRAEPEVVPAAGTRLQSRRRSAGGRRARRGKWFGLAAAAVVLVVLAGLVVVGGKAFFGGPSLPDDYEAGPGGPDVVVEVKSGDTAEEIAETMVDKGVVASSAAFYNAAVQNTGMNSMQPGFYSISTEIPGVDAVSQLVDPTSRVGQMVISEGRQLHDNSDVQTSAVKKGIYSLISEASCTGAGATKSCISYEDLDKAGASTDLDSLGVPDWAKSEVASVPDRDRQLEGLIAAGSWNFDPSAGPTEILKHLVTQSASSYEDTGIRTAGDSVGLSPYEMLIAASLIEREAMPDDFAKVARVIVNRLEVDQPLQFDSTVNYALDTTELATTDADRAQVTPWNTYASPGLPATPISSPSIGALEAIEAPEPGDWIYFVTVDAQGTTLFTKSYEEHLSNIDQALSSGILTSGR